MYKICTRSGDGEIAYDEFLKFWQNDKRFEKLQLGEEHLKVDLRASLYSRLTDRFQRLEQIVQVHDHNVY